MDSNKMPSCKYCDKEYSSTSTLNRHIQKVHGIETIEGSMKCLTCEKKFKQRMKLIQHLRNDHGQNIEEEVLEFKTTEEFEAWRMEEERKSIALFRKTVVDRPSRNGTTTHLVCCREGNYQPSEKKPNGRASKSQGSRKIGHTCTSHMVVNQITEPENKVIVKYVKTHYGHTPDVQHTPISKIDRAKIATKLSLGISESRVISDAINSDGPSRLNVLNKKDLANIRNQYGIGILGGRRHKNEMVSVDLWAKEEMARENPCIKYYKRYGNEDKHFAKDDFCLVIITEEQGNLLREHGSTVVCVDSTHGLGGSDRSMQLSTALVVDEYGEGTPVAFMYSNKIDCFSYEKMFLCMKETYGSTITCKYFMSDMADAIYNAWKEVMGDAGLRMFCSWHVLQAWQRNVTKVTGCSEEERKTNMNYVRLAIRSLLFEPDENTFHRKHEEFMDEIKKRNLKDFEKYWRERYASKVKEWAYCFRGGSPVTNNMHLESMHKAIKYFHFDGRHVRRLDESIAGVMQYLQRCFANRRRLQLKLRPCKKSKTIREAHKKSLNGLKIIQSQDDESLVANEKSGQVYLVIRQERDVCCPPIKQCFECKVCRHSYVCSCPNFFLDQNAICKHVHFVARHTLDQHSVLDDCNSNEVVGDVNKSEVIQPKSNSLSSALVDQNEFCKFSNGYLAYQEKFHLLPESNRKEVLRHMKMIQILLNNTVEMPDKGTEPLSKMHGRKRKITKQDVFCRYVTDVQKSKMAKKLKKEKKLVEPVFATEVQFNEFDQLDDCIVDHEEIV